MAAVELRQAMNCAPVAAEQAWGPCPAARLWQQARASASTPSRLSMLAEVGAKAHGCQGCQQGAGRWEESVDKRNREN